MPLPQVLSVQNDLNQKTHAASLIFMQTCLELNEKKEINIPRFDEIRLWITGLAGNLPPDPQSLESLSNTRNEIIKALRELFILKTYIFLTDEWLGQNAVLAQLANQDLKMAAPPKAEELFLEHMQILLTGRDGSVERELDAGALCEFVARIPLRITAARYYDYIGDAMKLMQIENRVDLLDDLKNLFYPLDYLDNNPASWYAPIKKQVDALWESERNHFDKTEMEKLRELEKHTIDIFRYLSDLFDAVTAAFIFLRSPDFQLPFIYSAFLDELSGKPSEEPGSFSGQINEAINLSLSGIKYSRRDDPFKQMDTDAPSAETGTKQLYGEWMLVHTYFYETALDYYSNLIKPLNTDAKIESLPLLPAFRAYMDSVVKELPAKRRRFLRQQFMRYLPYPYDLEAYKRYFIETYQSLDDANRGLLALFILAGGETLEAGLNAENGKL